MIFSFFDLKHLFPLQVSKSPVINEEKNFSFFIQSEIFSISEQIKISKNFDFSLVINL